MKKSIFSTYCVIAIAITCFYSCQKGKDIETKGYGKLSVQSTFESGSKPLLVQIDGTTIYTLKTTKSSSTGILVQSGDHKVSFVSTDDNKSLKDTSINIETGITLTLPRFWYRGGIFIFDDYNPEKMTKPATGKSLVRFITTDATLPDNMRIEIVIYYAIGRTYYKYATGITLQNVNKNNFSAYAEIPDWKTVLPANAQSPSYTIEGYDGVTGTKVIGGTTVTVRGATMDDLLGSGLLFKANTVWSFAIPNKTSVSTIFTKSLL